MNRSTIAALGHHAPAEVLSNQELMGRLGITSPEDWIDVRTGIRERRISRHAATSDLIIPAARMCLARANVAPTDVDCVIVSTITPDRPAPATAATVQRKLRAVNAWGFDLAAASSGFVFGLIVADGLVRSGRARRVLLCAADRMSDITDYSDAGTAVLFGDAAGAALITSSDETEFGILDAVATMDGRGEDQLYVSACGSAVRESAEGSNHRRHSIVQNGPAIFRAAVEGMVAAIRQLLEKSGLGLRDFKYVIPHQANGRILDKVALRLGLCNGQMVRNLQRYGNTCAATIPLCLSELSVDGCLRTGDRVMLVAFGAGYTTGAIHLRWREASAAAASSLSGRHDSGPGDAPPPQPPH